MDFERVDVTADRAALEVLAGLGREGKGGGRVVTPTTLVGTRIIRGGDLQAILKAREEQKDW